MYYIDDKNRPYYAPTQDVIAAYSLKAVSSSMWTDIVKAINTPTTKQLIEEKRAERDRRLTASDWTQLPDAPLAETAKTAWTDYRQALRDLPQQPGFPWDGDISNAPWPTEPSTTREHTPAKSTAKPNKKAKAE